MANGTKGDATTGEQGEEVVDENSAQGGAAGGANPPPPPTITPEGGAPNSGAAGGGGTGEAERGFNNPPDSKLDRDLVRWTRVVAILTGALVVAGLLQFGAALLQWNAMSGQLAEMRTSGTDTHHLVTATQNLATAGKAQASAAATQADSVLRSATATETASKATANLANSGRAQAAAVLQSVAIGKEANRIADRGEIAVERPWAEAMFPPNAPPLVAGQDYKVEVPLVNNGHAPATNLINNETFRVYRAGDLFSFSLPPCVSNCRSVVLFPNVPLALHPTIDKSVMTAQTVDDINNGRAIMALVITLQYSDNAGKIHHTHSCSMYSKDLGFSACAIGNEAD